ncbi:MAG: phosphoribosylaminoimidazolesuccinocarboxamide synthase, partial [Oligoflexia bacterium]|nr:phosphoribosylaminoimidazolesuccinocarboxamide synthase [Oligoflexia bacterium]
MIRKVDPNIMLVKEVRPILLEIIVRGYITGSLWKKYYTEGRRTFAGVTLPEGLKKFQALSGPLVTYTTKSITDEEINPEEILAQKILSKEHLDKIKLVATKLF